LHRREAWKTRGWFIFAPKFKLTLLKLPLCLLRVDGPRPLLGLRGKAGQQQYGKADEAVVSQWPERNAFASEGIAHRCDISLQKNCLKDRSIKKRPTDKS
jgi:hypothetical protein